MAFTTAPAKAARASAAHTAAAKASPEREEQEEEESSLSEIHSIGTQTTIVEVYNHEEEDPVVAAADLKMSASGSGATTVRFKPSKPKSTTITRGLSYTSLWPSAKDIVISAAPPNTCPDK